MDRLPEGIQSHPVDASRHLGDASLHVGGAQLQPSQNATLTSGQAASNAAASGHSHFEAPAALVGTMASTYTVGKELGKGTFGTVFETTGRGQPCAGKRVRNTKSPLSKAATEGSIIWGLAPHPNIIVLYDIVPTEGLIVMELGEIDLFKYSHIHGTGIPESTVRSLMRQMFAGLAHCHRRGVIHCDIKSSNLILFEKATVLKLADFGESLRTSVLPVPYEVCTRTHRAPEVFAGSDWGLPIDVWSAGVVMYETLFRRYPFTSESDRSILITIVKRLGLPVYLEECRLLPTRAWDETGRTILDSTKDSPRKEQLSAPSRNVLNRALDLDPEARITAAEAEELLRDA